MSKTQDVKQSSSDNKTAKSKSTSTKSNSGQQQKKAGSMAENASSQKGAKQGEEKKKGKEVGVHSKQKLLLKGWIIAVIILSITLALSFATIGTLSYFVAAKTSHTAFTIGDKVTMTIVQDGSCSSSIVYPRNTIPNMSVKQPITLFQPNQTQDLLIRAKLTLVASNGDSQAVRAEVTKDWQEGSDGYYYYKGVGKSNDQLLLATHIFIPKPLSSGQVRENCMITVVVESIQKVHQFAPQLWSSAPSDWLDTVAR